MPEIRIKLPDKLKYPSPREVPVRKVVREPGNSLRVRIPLRLPKEVTRLLWIKTSYGVLGLNADIWGIIERKGSAELIYLPGAELSDLLRFIENQAEKLYEKGELDYTDFMLTLSFSAGVRSEGEKYLQEHLWKLNGLFRVADKLNLKSLLFALSKLGYEPERKISKEGRW